MLSVKNITFLPNFGTLIRTNIMSEFSKGLPQICYATAGGESEEIITDRCKIKRGVLKTSGYQCLLSSSFMKQNHCEGTG